MKKTVFTLGLLLLATGTLTGCGTSGSGNRSLIPGVGETLVTGVVSVNSTLLGQAREASALGDTPVTNAEVIFTVEGENIALFKTKTGENGAFRLRIETGVRGRITVVKENRRLSAIMVTSRNHQSEVRRNINLESTVVEMALRNQNTLSYDSEAMEEQVRIGEASGLLNEVKDAYLQNRNPVITPEVLAESLTVLIKGEASALMDCVVGQEWCAAVGSLQAGVAPNTYTTRLLLRRDRTDGRTLNATEATVGAGYLILRLPAGVSLQSLNGQAVMNGDVHLEGSLLQDEQLFQVSFLHNADQGINQAVKLADLTLTSTRTLTPDDRIVVTEQRLLGVLNEKRSGPAREASLAPLP